MSTSCLKKLEGPNTTHYHPTFNIPQAITVKHYRAIITRVKCEVQLCIISVEMIGDITLLKDVT